ncbi:MAG: hypothetical protein ACR2HN_05610 [Tepidiformaceae bacterium]
MTARRPSASSLRVGDSLPEYEAVAFNGAVHSVNKIHDDEVARQYGFAGGLVPGVTIYAYMTRPLMDALGHEWLNHGRINVRLLKPFYAGELVTVRTVVGRSEAGELALGVVALNAAGETCAAATASLGGEPAAAAAPIAHAPLPGIRPAVSREALAGADVLGSLDEVVSATMVDEYLEEVQDDFPAYRGSDAVLASGLLIRRANWILEGNVVLNPWLHVSSDIVHYSLAHPGEHLSTRGRVTALFERRGHQFVDMDVVVLAGEDRPVMGVHHTAIYDIRNVETHP